MDRTTTDCDLLDNGISRKDVYQVPPGSHRNRHRLLGSRWLRLGLVAALAVPLAGCKTDRLSGPSREEEWEGPVTSLENPAGMNVPPVKIGQRTEVDLVEEMITHRTMYARYLRALATYYSDHGFPDKARWARRELNDLRLVKPYRYVHDVEVPQATLQPTDTISDADRLYQEGLNLMEEGGHGVPALYNQRTMKLALARFKELIDRYPNSDKIDDAAFYIAEIHKEYFEETDNSIAIMWYQRAIDWNPNLPHPARFQMAVVYDYRLHEREKALEMYQEVIENETFNRSNVDWAKARIAQLTSSETRYAPGEPSPGPRPTAAPPDTTIEPRP
jgi:hypothetical protein